MPPVQLSFQPSYRPGETIEISGIYRVFHESPHMIVLDVVCVKGGVFPKCKQCKATFMLVHRYSELADIFPES
jgi:hypothetical protein